jgi:hypothetical protein
VNKLLLLALFTSVAQAGTIALPDPSVYVDLRSNRTTVGVDGVYYQAPSQFVYVSECPKPDGPRYHCNIVTEDTLVLTATDGSGTTIVVSIQAAVGSTLHISGHNYWSPFQTLISGSVTTP